MANEVLEEHEIMTEALRKYITAEKTDYAILLNGVWGTGKTHFIKEFQERTKDGKTKVVYYSLNGVTEMHKVTNSILVAILANVDSDHKVIKLFRKTIEKSDKIFDLAKKEYYGKIFNFLKLGADFISENFMQKILNTQRDSKIIVILDDLERVSCNIHVTDLFGELYAKFIANGIKTIFVANEKEISDGDGAYNREKEKYIRRTVTFVMNYRYIYETFLRERFNDVPIEWLDSLLAVFGGKQVNLRTVQFALDLFKELYDFWKTDLNEKDYENPDKYFYSICAYARFYKQENTIRTDKDILFEKLQKGFLNKPANGQADEYDKFIEKFSTTSHYLHAESCLLDLVYDGILDRKVFKTLLEKQEEFDDSLIRLSRPYNYEKPELEALVQKINENLTAKKYTVREYQQLRSLFVPFAVKLDIANKDDIQQRIRESVFAEKNKGALYELYDYMLRNPLGRIQTDDKEFERLFDEQFKTFQETEDKGSISQIFKAIEDGDGQKLWEYHKMNDYTIFIDLEKNGYFEKIPTLKNKSINVLINYINAAINSLGNAYRFYTNQIPLLEKLKAICETEAEKNKETDFLKANMLEQLTKTIETAIEHIKQSRKNFE